jgi:hypothetical protein
MHIHLHNNPVLTNLLGAGRRLREGTRRHSRKWSEEIIQELHRCCDSAANTVRSLHGRDFKSKLLTLLAIFGRFMRETYLDKPVRLLRQGFGKRTACFMIAGVLPLFTALVMIVVPAMIFSSPQSRSYYHFARTLAYDPASMLPVLLGLITLTVMLRMPPSKRVQHGGPGGFA